MGSPERCSVCRHLDQCPLDGPTPSQANRRQIQAPAATVCQLDLEQAIYAAGKAAGRAELAAEVVAEIERWADATDGQPDRLVYDHAVLTIQRLLAQERHLPAHTAAQGRAAVVLDSDSPGGVTGDAWVYLVTSRHGPIATISADSAARASRAYRVQYGVIRSPVYVVEPARFNPGGDEAEIARGRELGVRLTADGRFEVGEHEGASDGDL